MVIDSYSERLLRGSSVSTIVGERMDCTARIPKGGGNKDDDSAGPENWDGSGKWMTRKKKLL